MVIVFIVLYIVVAMNMQMNISYSCAPAPATIYWQFMCGEKCLPSIYFYLFWAYTHLIY